MLPGQVVKKIDLLITTQQNGGAAAIGWLLLMALLIWGIGGSFWNNGGKGKGGKK